MDYLDVNSTFTDRLTGFLLAGLEIEHKNWVLSFTDNNNNDDDDGE